MAKPFYTLCLLVLFAATVNALHFYLDANEKRCFIEEIPTDTVVSGDYRALEWSEKIQEYVGNSELGIWIDVEEVHTSHSVVHSKGPSNGRFTFTSHEPGDHSICLSTNYTSWFSNTHLRIYLDVTVGSVKPNAEQDRTHVADLAAKVRDLNQKLEDVRREQQYQREREAAYRNLSEDTNSKAVWYSLVQMVVLVATCFWQLRHLRHFFEDRKMR